MTRHRRHRRTEAGNAFFLILIGIVLFAALNYTFVRANRTRGNLSAERAGFAANDIMRFADDLHIAVQSALTEGTTPSQISFENTSLTGYTNINAGAVKLLDSSTGGLRYPIPDTAWLDTSASAQPLYREWYFPARLCVAGAGAGGASCNSDGAANEEIVAVLPYLRQEVCLAMNQRLGIPLCGSDACANASVVFPAGNPKYTGTAQSDGAMIRSPGGELDGRQEGCVRGGGGQAAYYFYYKVLAER